VLALLDALPHLSRLLHDEQPQRALLADTLCGVIDMGWSRAGLAGEARGSVECIAELEIQSMLYEMQVGWCSACCHAVKHG